MGKIAGLTQMFSSASIAAQLSNFENQTKKKVVDSFAYLGEETVNDARSKTAQETYIDRTGNLRNSIGYAVLEDGKPRQGFTGGGEGGAKAKSLLQSVRSGQKDGVDLVIVAGMEYAAPVEALEGHSVLSGSIPTQNQIVKHLKDTLG